jgi:hypothetical protein
MLAWGLNYECGAVCLARVLGHPTALGGQLQTGLLPADKGTAKNHFKNDFSSSKFHCL